MPETSTTGKRKAFAYLLLACSRTQELQSDFPEWHYGDVIECFSECEDRAETADGLWTFDWDQQMTRVAPVQLTLGWDPRPYLQAALRRAGVEADFWTGYSGHRHLGEDENTLSFAQLPANTGSLRCDTGLAPDTGDTRRFDEVLTATVELAREQGRGLLFVGGWG